MKGYNTMTINEYEKNELYRDIFEHLCIASYNESMQNQCHEYQSLDYKTTICNRIANGIDSTGFIYHSVCDAFMVANTYKLFQLIENKNLWNTYKNTLKLLLKKHDFYYYHMNTAQLYSAMYVLITNNVLKECKCTNCNDGESNDGESNDGATDHGESNTSTGNTSTAADL
jgi:hypothetical protein